MLKKVAMNHICDHCGKPAICARYRTMYANTQFEQTVKCFECDNCMNKSDAELYPTSKCDTWTAIKGTIKWYAQLAAIYVRHLTRRPSADEIPF